jgi:hypothetical protein
VLGMRTACERCGRGLPANAGEALICAFECTFCTWCADDIGRHSPNCGGELVPRPRREPRSPALEG